MRINLPKTNARLTNYNPSSELHGDERVPVSYIRFRASLPNGFLDQLHGTLKHACYFHDTENPGNDLADKAMEGNPDYLPHLRFPNMVLPLKWKDSMEGGVLTIHRGVSPASNIVLNDIRLDDLALTPKAGGSLEIEFKVRAKPDEDQGGKLTTLVQQDVDITIEAPKAEGEQANLLEEPKP